MLNILKEVAAERLLNNDLNTTIQLSSTFMKEAVKEANSVSGKELIEFNENMTEFKHVFFGKVYLIKNRAYRDDTNDKDVEKIILIYLIS